MAMRRNLAGVGYVLTGDDEICGIDLDECRYEETGSIEPWALEIIGLAETYAEVSPSGTGIRLFARGKPEKSVKSGAANVEIYGAQRYLTVTGDHIEGTPSDIHPAPQTIQALMKRVEQAREDASLRSAEGKGDRPPAIIFSTQIEGATDTGVGEITDLLAYIPADCGYDEWLQALMAVHAATGGSSSGMSIADQWSSQGAKYKAGEVERKWRSFRSAGVNGATLAALARQYGADLSAIRISHMPEDREAIELGVSITERLMKNIATRAAEEVRARPSRLEWFDDIGATIRSPYLIKGLLDRAATSVVYGPSNCGKTFFVLDLAFHVAIDAAWRGRRVAGGGVLYLAAEGGYGIANRIAALKETYGSCDVPFALRRAGLDLLKPTADTQHVINLAEEVNTRAPLALIVIDTLSRVIAGGDENAASDMTAFVRNVDTIREATGAHVLIVHHTGKEAAKGARGHSSLKAAIDTEIELAVDDFGGRFAHVHKQRDLESGQDFHFALKPIHLGFDQDGDDVTSCIVEVIDQKEKPSSDMPPMAVCKSILADIQESWDRENPYSMSPQVKRSGRYGPAVLSKKYETPINAMTNLLSEWINNEIITTDMCCKVTKKRGLKVIGNLNPEDW